MHHQGLIGLDQVGFGGTMLIFSIKQLLKTSPETDRGRFSHWTFNSFQQTIHAQIQNTPSGLCNNSESIATFRIGYIRLDVQQPFDISDMFGIHAYNQFYGTENSRTVNRQGEDTRFFQRLFQQYLSYLALTQCIKDLATPFARQWKTINFLLYICLAAAPVKCRLPDDAISSNSLHFRHSLLIIFHFLNVCMRDTRLPHNYNYCSQETKAKSTTAQNLEKSFFS